MKLTRSPILFVLGISMLLGVTLIGCQKNPAVGKVTGTITLDGKPLPNAAIIFHPDDSNALSPLGGTDSNGQYELFYIDNKSGAVPGQYTVTVSTAQSWNNIPESVPQKYVDKTLSELKYTVKTGKQVIDIKLSSK